VDTFTFYNLCGGRIEGPIEIERRGPENPHYDLPVTLKGGKKGQRV
jgi:hypothetical protein